MSAVKLFLFDAEAEARAFAAGVEFVNDSAIEVDGIGPIMPGPRIEDLAAAALGPGWLVSVNDEDADPDDGGIFDHRTPAGERAERIMAASIRPVS